MQIFGLVIERASTRNARTIRTAKLWRFLHDLCAMAPAQDPNTGNAWDMTVKYAKEFMREIAGKPL